jgi:hypothetical protein
VADGVNFVSDEDWSRSVPQLPQKRWRESRAWPQTGQVDTGGVYRRVLHRTDDDIPTAQVGRRSSEPNAVEIDGFRGRLIGADHADSDIARYDPDNVCQHTQNTA